MAAPHVSGAVLLLREAFPDLTGEEILLAIYNSAIDLGEEGEDNTYGMGFVNVKAAYDLLSESHTPTPPAVLSTDIELVRIVNPSDDIICTNANLGITPVIEVRNNGNETIDGFDLLVSVIGETAEVPIAVETVLAPGESAEVELEEIIYEGTGFKELHVHISPIEGEYDVLNNHAIHRFTEIPKYDWEEEGAFSDDFSGGINSDVWTVYNPDASITWDTLSVLQIDGTEGLAAHMNHPEYLTVLSQDDHLISPLIENRPETTNSMAFDYYYRKRSSQPFTMDTLVVFINRNCGDEYMSEELLRLGGTELWTNDDSEQDALPETADEWRTVNLDMGLEDTDPFFFSFVSLNRRGNNLLIDNVRMGVNLSTSEALYSLEARIYPNPANSEFRLEWNETIRADVRIYDLSGRMISFAENQESGVIIETLNLSKGAYIVEVSVGENKSSQKLIVN
jgi:bacillopeptidase F